MEPILTTPKAQRRPPRWLRRALVGVLAVGFVGSLSVRPAAARECSCEPIRDRVDSADAVFVGTAVDVNTEVVGRAGPAQLWNFDVSTTFVGPDAPTLAVSGGGELSNCHQSIEAGREYGVAAFWSEGHLAAGRCGFFEPTQVTALFDTAPVDRRPIISAVVIGAAAVIGLSVLYRRRRPGAPGIDASG